jgi:hypothetical protein
MRRWLFLFVVLPFLLTGCASTIRSEVTAFHQWPKDSATQSFVFERSDAEEKDLEYRNYENLVRAQLQKLGLRDAGASETPALQVKFNASIKGRDVRVIETVLVDSWYGTPWYGPGFYPGFYPGWSAAPGLGYPYGPMWPTMPVAREQERRYTVFHRELKIKISDTASGQPLYEVTVRSDGKEGNLARVMPYLVQSAFADFPGKNGVPYVVDLKMKE